ncbi:hypothetical protein ABZ379_49565 [Streptomyces canus]|uniref:hypothetical protein n=1 Tax=Streptomyces canus TaxID=58343 RepID=UPI0033FFB860
MSDNGPPKDSIAGDDRATLTGHARRSTVMKVLSKKKIAWLTTAGLTCAVAGFTGLGTSFADTSPTAGTPTPTASPSPSLGARSGPEDGGATGIVKATFKSGFTFSTPAGVEVTVKETASTTYAKKTHHTSANVVKKGKSVLVLGVVDNTTITAEQVIVQPGGDGGASAAQAAGVLAFQKGTPSPDKRVGTIPEYNEGDGTIVSGAKAYRVVKAAQAVVPGGIVDRVVQLADGEYETHNIGVLWPHHVFVDKNLKVVGWY